MNKRTFFAFMAVAGTLPIALVTVYLASAAPKAVAQTAPTEQTAPATRAAAHTAPLPASVGGPAVVDAANAFLATLTPQQRTVAQIDLTPQNAARWSNFPAAVVPRNGVYFRDMTSTQAEAALKIVRLALSKDGLSRFQEIRVTDDAFAKIASNGGGPGGRGQGGPGGPPPGGSRRPGGPPGGGGPRDFGPGGLFGHGNYIVAFLGKPSKTTPWLLQIGGHHLAFNIYYKGKAGAATPYFVGAQPNIWKDDQGKTHAPLAPMRNAVYNLLHSLTPDQLTQARLSASFDDVYVGPGRDGQFPPVRAGVPVSALSAASKAFVRQAIAAWTGDTAQGAAYQKRYFAELGQTKVAWSGTTAVSAAGDYVRIDGPHVWIEFICQGSDHYHTIWRDRASDYGAEFSF